MSKFQEMFSKDVSQKVEKKNGLSYLSWAWAWAEVKKIDENASYEIHEDQNGNAFFASQLGIDCKVSVTIHGKTHTMRLPVMDGANKAMKFEAYTYVINKYEWVSGRKQLTGKEEKTVEAATSFDVNKTIMRCLVKAIAMHGLGLYIYAGEDLPEDVSTDTKSDSKQELKSQANGLTVKPYKESEASSGSSSQAITKEEPKQESSPAPKKSGAGWSSKAKTPAKQSEDIY